MAAVLRRADLIVAGEVREWENTHYAADIFTVGEKRGLVTIGRVASEDPGMRVCAAWLKTVVNEIPVHWIYAGRSLLEGRLMTAREVVDLIKKNVGVPWNDQSYRDTFKLGNPDSTVKGIATTVMVRSTCSNARNQAGLNMVISHEDTFWNDRDETKDLTANPLYKMKTEYVRKNDMVIWRIHDHMHAMHPDFTVVGSLRSVGMKGGEDAVMRPAYITIPETTLGEFASAG